MPKEKAFIDSSVVIRGLIYPQSNSARILDLAAERRLLGVVNNKVLRETLKVIKDLKGREQAYRSTVFLESVMDVAEDRVIQPYARKIRGAIKEKDLEHLATVKALRLKHLIAYDKDFNGVEEYRTPKNFLKKLGLKTADTEY